jgi:cell division septation protein DedD
MEWVKERMHQAKLQRSQIQAQGADATQGSNPGREPEGTIARPSRSFILNHRLSWLAGGMALGSMIVIMVWEPGLVGSGGKLTAIDLSGDSPDQHRNVLELPLRSSTTDTEGLRKDIILLTEQLQTLTTSVSDLKIELLRIHAVTDSIAALGNQLPSDASRPQDVLHADVTQLETLPAPAAGKNSASTPDGKDTDKSADAASPPLAASRKISPVAPAVRTRETTIDNGHWVINLASLPNKADAERFMTNARSRGVATDLYQVTVRGKEYWRVHVPGFTTADEANAKATLIKGKLGLKDAWVAKR